MRHTLLWLAVLAALVLYSIMVYGWWVEGNQNRYQQQIEQNNVDKL